MSPYIGLDICHVKVMSVFELYLQYMYNTCHYDKVIIHIVSLYPVYNDISVSYVSFQCQRLFG